MELKIDVENFRYRPGKYKSVKEIPTKIKDIYDSNKDYRSLLEEYTEEIRELQDIMYAHDRYALLLIFQGMDTAGKDGAIRHVMSGVNPLGINVAVFKKPNDQELDHDWMWRTNKHMPERGRITIFNRSYYEEVLVVKVHPEIVQSYQRIPKEMTADLDKLWEQRYADIRNLEDYHYRNGTHVLKFYFHMSKDEQKERLLERIDEPEKNWKMSLQDIKERHYWDAYMAAYYDLLEATHTKESPWYVIPADDKKNARLIISQVILSHIKSLHMGYPEVSAAYKTEMQEARKALLAE